MSVWTDMIANDAEFSLNDALDSTEDDFSSDFREYWGLESSAPPDWMDPTEWLELRKLYGLAGQIAEVTSTLVKRKGLGDARLAQPAALSAEAKAFQAKIDDLLALVESKGGLEAWGKIYWKLTPQAPSDPRTRRGVFRNSLEIAISRLFFPTLFSVTERAEELISRLVTVPGNRARAYLSRVARCYCLDQRPELAVMCRAVVDAALSGIVSDEDVRMRRGLPKRDRIGLSHRLAHVESLDLLPKNVTEAIVRLKTAGDDAVHVSPGLEPTREALMDDLVIILNAISDRRG